VKLTISLQTRMLILQFWICVLNINGVDSSQKRKRRKNGLGRGNVPTWQLPWLACMKIDFNQSSLRYPLVSYFLVQVVAHQLFIAWIKPKTRRQSRFYGPQSHYIWDFFNSITQYLVGKALLKCLEPGLWMLI
jgi:hypothetical protein